MPVTLWVTYSTFPVGNAGPAVRTYVPITIVQFKKKIVAGGGSTTNAYREYVTDFQLSHGLPHTVPGSPDCRNASHSFHCRTYRLMLSCLHASIIYQSSRCAQLNGMYVIQDSVFSRPNESGEKLAGRTLRFKFDGIDPFFFHD